MTTGRQAMVAQAGNLFEQLPVGEHADEIFHTLLTHTGCRIERIVSSGQASPEGFWYDQDEAEWVVLIQGAASLRFEDEAQARTLTLGDYLYISPHRRHRVEFTQAMPPTIWLAIYIK